jgi:hypothetical protein
MRELFKLKESVDIYELPSINKNQVVLQFYKINTRERFLLEVDKKVGVLLAKLDGKKFLNEILVELNFNVNQNELKELFDYLSGKGVLINTSNISSKNDHLKDRYDRQINYFDDLVTDKTGIDAQYILGTKEVVIFGLGAVGSNIAIQLVRSGVKKLVLVDYKRLTKANLGRHTYAYLSSEGRLKTEALKEYLETIDPECCISCINCKVLPDTDIWSIVPLSCNVVINSADEPYIGHITLKLGRALWEKGIALYVAGGFDAHNMSTGEFIIPYVTPCADCYSNTFKNALKNWKPTYPQSEVTLKYDTDKLELSYENIILGGAGGIMPQALFSASYAAINIINYLIGNLGSKEKFNKRGEYIFNKGIMTWIDLKTQESCHVCKF